MVALKHKSFASVTELISLGVAMDITDIKENSVLHYAAQSSPQILAVSLILGLRRWTIGANC
jgi:hypothetical protein